MKNKSKKKFFFKKNRLISEDFEKSPDTFNSILDQRSPFMFPSLDIGFYLKSQTNIDSRKQKKKNKQK